MPRFPARAAMLCASLVPALLCAQTLNNSVLNVIPNTTQVDRDFNANVTAVTQELVTTGIPFAACTLFDSKDFRLLDGRGAEVSVFVKETMAWPDTKAPCNRRSIRALKVQFLFDATVGDSVEYSWTLAGRDTAADRQEQRVADGEIADDRPIKGGLSEPRVFAISDPEYLVQTGIMAPTVVIGESSYDSEYYPAQWERFVKDYDLTHQEQTKAQQQRHADWTPERAISAAEGVITDDWLYDKASTAYRQALRRGNVEEYREAYLLHEWYISQIEVTGNRPYAPDNYCVGGFDVGPKAATYGSGGDGCDSKYVYTEPYKLHLALTGDDSWQPQENGIPSAAGIIDDRNEAFRAIADLVWDGSTRGGSNAGVPTVPPAGFSAPYLKINDLFTERKAGFGLQVQQSVCEMTLDDEICGRLGTAIDNLYLMYTENPDGRGITGYLGHSWRQHEGEGLPWLGSLVQDYNAATTIAITNTVANGPETLIVGDSVRVGRINLTLTAVPTKLPNDNWQLQVSPALTNVSSQVGQRVFALTEANKGNEAVIFDQATDRVFSPWMQSIIADALWTYYHWSDDADRKQKVREMLTGFAHAYASYAIDGTRVQSSVKQQIEQAFGVTIFNTGITSTVGCGLQSSPQAPYTRYVANDLMGTAYANREWLVSMFESGGYADQHIPEGIFQLSLGIYFETDTPKKDAMNALAQSMLKWWDTTCTIGANIPPRSYGWQNRPDPYGTYAWVQKSPGANP